MTTSRSRRGGGGRIRDGNDNEFVDRVWHGRGHHHAFGQGCGEGMGHSDGRYCYTNMELAHPPVQCRQLCQRQYPGHRRSPQSTLTPRSIQPTSTVKTTSRPSQRLQPGLPRYAGRHIYPETTSGSGRWSITSAQIHEYK